MAVVYNPVLIASSVGVAIFASYVALNLAYTVTQARGRSQLAWLAAGALAMGVGIWSMHFVGMLAFEMPGMSMGYDIPLMVLSVVVAVLGSALGLHVISRPVVPTSAIVIGSTAMAVAIAGMHYIGMYSMRMAAVIEWNYYLVTASVIIALGASLAALTILHRLRHRPDRLLHLGLASTLMGFAIAGMHYTGMVAATFKHDHAQTIGDSNLLVSSGLTLATISTTLLILILALASSIAQRVLSMRQRRSDERFRLLIDAVKDYAIFLIDPVGRITTWNFGAARMTGYRDGGIVGQPLARLYDRTDVVEMQLSHARQTGHFEGEVQCTRDDGSTFWANAVLDPLLECGKLTGFSVVLRDVTLSRSLNEELERRVQQRTLEVREREAQLRAAKEEAEVANATKSAFLANMSHEIRTPLGALIGFSELMLNDEMSSDDRRRAIEIIKKNGRVLSTIINDILDLSKVEAGKLEFERVEVPLPELLNEIRVLLDLEASGKGIRLQIVAAPGLRPFLRTDPTRLRQILFNIIGNAIKFTARGSVTVTVQPADDPCRIAFVVTDTGSGIAPEQVERLFAPFTQADVTTTRKFGGTGLGLVLSRKLAVALGGDVRLHASTPGIGSTFVITIEHGWSADASMSRAPRVARPPVQADRLRGQRVLVVDDSPDNLELIEHVLRAAGGEVTTASNGVEGVSAALSNSFDVILMDLQMPEMDGFTATRELRERGFDRPILALTAHAMKEERERCLASGFDDHLTKPIDRQALIGALAHFTTDSRLRITLH